MTKVICPTSGYSQHESWCYRNRAITTNDHATRADQPTYTRVFDDADLAREFRFDNRIKG